MQICVHPSCVHLPAFILIQVMMSWYYLDTLCFTCVCVRVRLTQAVHQCGGSIPIGDTMPICKLENNLKILERIGNSDPLMWVVMGGHELNIAKPQT